jgi:hypothetical protein
VGRGALSAGEGERYPESLRFPSAFALALLVAASARAADRERGPIQDNSFLLEEAYNQERAVMQTIQTWSRVSQTGEWLYTLTQEFPIPAERHQISYTLPILQDDAGDRGVGDLFVNYRYQLLGGADARVAIAPRVSVIAPTGNADRKIGSGGWGLQVAVPVSTMIGKKLVSHTNVGGTAIADARSGDDWNLFFGQSFVWLLHPSVNLMVEGLLYQGNGGADGAPHTDMTISPGVRFAIDLPHGLQVVPGIAFPIGVGGTSGKNGVFLYLSFEHPFRKGASS